MAANHGVPGTVPFPLIELDPVIVEVAVATGVAVEGVAVRVGVAVPPIASSAVALATELAVAVAVELPVVSRVVVRLSVGVRDGVGPVVPLTVVIGRAESGVAEALTAVAVGVRVAVFVAVDVSVRVGEAVAATGVFVWEPGRPWFWRPAWAVAPPTGSSLPEVPISALAGSRPAAADGCMKGHVIMSVLKATAERIMALGGRF